MYKHHKNNPSIHLSIFLINVIPIIYYVSIISLFVRSLSVFFTLMTFHTFAPCSKEGVLLGTKRFDFAQLCMILHNFFRRLSEHLYFCSNHLLYDAKNRMSLSPSVPEIFTERGVTFISTISARKIIRYQYCSILSTDNVLVPLSADISVGP